MFLLYFFKKIGWMIISTLKHWYIDSFYFVYNMFIKLIKKLDRK